MHRTMLFSLILALSASIAQSNELTLKCSSGWFSSFSITTKGDRYFLDGTEFPSYSEKINSAGKLWAKIRTAEIIDDKLELLTATKNIRTGYVSKVDYFVLNLNNLSFREGVSRKTGNRNAMLADWLRGAAGKCKIIKLK